MIGTFIGMLSGLGPMSIIAIMIPVAINLGRTSPSRTVRFLPGLTFPGDVRPCELDRPGAGEIATNSSPWERGAGNHVGAGQRLRSEELTGTQQHSDPWLGI